MSALAATVIDTIPIEFNLNINWEFDKGDKGANDFLRVYVDLDPINDEAETYLGTNFDENDIPNSLFRDCPMKDKYNLKGVDWNAKYSSFDSSFNEEFEMVITFDITDKRELNNNKFQSGSIWYDRYYDYYDQYNTDRDGPNNDYRDKPEESIYESCKDVVIVLQYFTNDPANDDPQITTQQLLTTKKDNQQMLDNRFVAFVKVSLDIDFYDNVDDEDKDAVLEFEQLEGYDISKRVRTYQKMLKKLNIVGLNKKGLKKGWTKSEGDGGQYLYQNRSGRGITQKLRERRVKQLMKTVEDDDLFKTNEDLAKLLTEHLNNLDKYVGVKSLPVEQFLANYTINRFDHVEQAKVIEGVKSQILRKMVPCMYNYMLEEEEDTRFKKQFLDDVKTNGVFETDYDLDNDTDYKDGIYKDYNRVSGVFSIYAEKTIIDKCNTSKILTWKPKKPLSNPIVPAEVASLTYRYKDEGKDSVMKEYEVRYYKTGYRARSARLMKIKCEDPCKGFTHYEFDGNQDQVIKGTWDPYRIEINLVYLGKARGNKHGGGHCTKAVGYVLKTLLIEAEKENEFPYKGKVYISSINPCNAVNCYSHAFISNGFYPDEDEIRNFREDMAPVKLDSDQEADDTVEFTFTMFHNSKQMKKYNSKLEDLKKKKKKEKEKAKREKLNKEIRDMSRERAITRSQERSIADRVRKRHRKVWKELKKQAEERANRYQPNLKF